MGIYIEPNQDKREWLEGHVVTHLGVTIGVDYLPIFLF